MPSVLVVKVKEVRDDGSIVEAVVWRLDRPVPPCIHRYKYRLYYGTAEGCRIRYDNEFGKGDHKHVGAFEEQYVFKDLQQLLADFAADVADWGLK